jgi:hypothetical protein
MTEKRSLKGSLFKSSSSVSDDALKRHLEKLSNLQRTVKQRRETFGRLITAFLLRLPVPS